jgi:hypothetical protein
VASDRDRLKERWRRGQHGWPAGYPLAQAPNPPLLLAAAGWLLAAVAEGAVHDYARAAAWVGFAAWAWLELADGVNAFRRLLGLAGLVAVIAQIGGAL